MPSNAVPPIALTIAGSDSGGGAGIQADLKTFQRLGVHGVTAITAVTAQNTRTVASVHPLPLAQIRAQLGALFEDFPIAAVKTGMLGSAPILRGVTRELRRRQPPWLVVDPVMIASSGARLLDETALAAMINELLPLADILTPNLPEAEALLGRPITSADDADTAGAELLALGARGVLLKGGHGHGDILVDRYYDPRGKLELAHPRLDREGHGTGCTLSAAIAAELAGGRTPRNAVRRAVNYVRQALAAGYRPGGGVVHVLRH